MSRVVGRGYAGKGEQTVDYTIRVIATNLISGTVTVCAESKEEALGKVERRINPQLKKEGYEIQLEILATVDRAQLAA